MATRFREGNRRLWIGMRPGHAGAQVLDQGSANNATTTIYTVPAGYTLLIFAWYLDTVTSGAGSGTFALYDDAGVLMGYIWRHVFLVAGAKSNGLAPFVPYEVPAGGTVRLTSSAAGLTSYAGIMGILIPN